MNDYYDQFTDVLGAYALDAVESDEAERIELHLATCPRCRAEVVEHREVASILSQSGTAAPEGIWNRIAAELSPPAPPLRLTVEPPAAVAPEPQVVPTAIGSAPSARRRVQTRTVMAIVAVAASIVAVLGVVTVGQSQRLNKLETAMNDQSIDRIAKEAVEGSAVKVDLEGEAGTAKAVVGESGHGYLVMADMPAPDDGMVYQLWGKVDGTILSLGTFGPGNAVVPFSVDPERLDGIELFAVTQEKAPGVVTSTNKPVMAGEV